MTRALAAAVALWMAAAPAPAARETATAATVTATTVTVTDPVQMAVPESALATFRDCRELAPALPGDRPLLLPAALPLPARIDLLVARGGHWLLLSSFAAASAAGLQTTIPEGRVAVLARPCQSRQRLYAWGEGDTGSTAITLSMEKTIPLPTERSQRIEGAYLFLDGAALPRALDRRAGLQFEHLPLRRAILCLAQSADGDTCSLVPETSTIPEPPALSAPRLFLGGRAALPMVRTAGTSILRPKERAAVVIRAGEWAAVGSPAGAIWSSAVLLWQERGHLLDLFRGDDLQPVPRFEVLAGQLPEPMRLRPAIAGADRVEPGALVALVTPGDPAIPVSVTPVGVDGVAELSVPEGRYAVRLLSSLARATPVVAELRGHGVIELEFPPSLLLHGRILSGSGATLPRPTFVRTLPRKRSRDGSAPAGDVAEGARETTVGEDGRFRIGVSQPGLYSLMVVSGTEHFVKEIEVAGSEDLDVGTITLSRGVTLRGSVEGGCAGGMVTLTPLPSPSAATAGGLSDPRRIALAADATFQAEGLAAGSWLASATCADSPRRELLSPAPFEVPSATEVLVVQFGRQKP
jgi:hypothetical protein